MSRLLLPLAFLLAVGPARAQDREPSPAQRGVVVTVGTLSAIGAASAAYGLLGQDSDDRTGVTLVVLSYAGGMAAGTALAAQALGLGAPFEAVLVDAALGVPVGAAVGGLAGLVVGGARYLPTMDVDYNLMPPLIGGAVGIVTAVGVSAMVASRRVEAPMRVEVMPTVLRAPTGEPGLGLTLRVGL